MDLIYAIPLGLIGGLVGLLFTLSLKGLQKIFLPMKSRVVLRGLLGGLGMGLIGALLPLTLFSGEIQTNELIHNAAQIGFLMLIVLSISKLLATSLVLATGWKGGYIFPVMFAGVALGMAANLIFPNIPVAVAVSATIAGALVATLKAPLFCRAFYGHACSEGNCSRNRSRDCGKCIDFRIICPVVRPARVKPGCNPPQS